jgi:hypothetical protein
MHKVKIGRGTMNLDDYKHKFSFMQTPKSGSAPWLTRRTKISYVICIYNMHQHRGMITRKIRIYRPSQLIYVVPHSA